MSRYLHRTRIVHGLVSAELSDRSPFPDACTAVRRMTRAQRLGKRFELAALTKISAFLGGGIFSSAHTPVRLNKSQWIAFTDKNGNGFAQPDGYFIRNDSTLVIIECKYTQTSDADKAMQKLYTPLLRHIYEPRRIVRVQCCKVLKGKFPAAVHIEMPALLDIKNEKAEHILQIANP